MYFYKIPMNGYFLILNKRLVLIHKVNPLIMKYLISKIDLNDLTQDSLNQIVNEQNEITTPVYLSFKFTKRRLLVIYKLFIKVNDGKTKNVLSDGKALKASNGNETILLGKYKKGDKLEVNFEILGITKVPKIIALISQDIPLVINQVLPKQVGKPHTIERGTPPWKGTFKYQIQ